MKKLLFIITILFVIPLSGQEKQKNNLFKSIYKDFLKYGTVYGQEIYLIL